MDELMILLLACSAFTALVTEAVKKTVGDVLPSNILVAVVSVVVAGLICAGYVVMYDVALTTKTWVEIIALIILSWLCAMCGFDKVKQTILQIGAKDE